MKSKDFLNEKWSQKYKKSINCNNPKGFSQRAHCQGRKKHTNEAKDTFEENLNENQEKYILYLNDKPVSVYTSSVEANNQAKMVAQKYPTARITVKKEVCTLTPMQLEENLRDWFGKGKQGGAGGGGWDRYNTKGERIGKCGDRKPGEGKPKCLSKSKAAALRAKGGKKAIAAAVRRKRSKDTNPERKGSAINVSNKI